MYRFPAPRPMAPYPNPHWNYHRPPANQQWFPNPRFGPAPRPHMNNVRFNKPANDDFWCETCDRGFSSEIQLNKHKQEHQKCNIDGCQFIAHPKVITKHIQMQHSSGLYKKIAKLNNPEDIEKWREERRKKYPTKANIDKKEAAIKEKIERGEKMGLGKDKRNNGEFRKEQGQGLKRKSNKRYENQNRSKFRKTDNTDNKILATGSIRKPRIKKPDVIPTVEEKRKLKPFAGIQGLIEDDLVTEDVSTSYQIEDIDLDVQETRTEESVKPALCGALSSLICDYGSSEDENEETTNKIQSTKEYNKPINRLSEMNRKDKVGTVTENLSPVLEKSNIIIKNQNNDSCVDQAKMEKEKLVTENSISQNNKNTIENKSDETASGETKVETKKHSFTKNVSKNIVAENKGTIEHQNDDDAPDEAKVEKKDQSINENISKNVAKKKIQIKEKPIFKRPKPKLPSTLLHKLLSREMQQERNIVLQCIRYIRKNNYFDKSVSS